MSASVRLLLGLFAVATTAEVASAQFFPGGGGRSVFTRNIGVSYVTPFGGYYLTQQRFSTRVNAFPAAYAGIYPSPTRPAYLGPITVSPLFYGAVGTPMYGAGADAEAVRRAQRGVRQDPVARRKAVDDVVGGRKPADPAAVPVAEPTDADVLSGRPLNLLVFEIDTLQGKGNARGPFFTPDLLSNVQFAGGPAADAVNLFRGETPAWPDALSGGQFEAGRAAVTKEYQVVVEALKAGKKADHATLDRLAAATHALKEEFAPVLRASAGTDPATAAEFLNRIDAAAAHLKTPAATDLLVPTWHTIGVPGGELVKHLVRHKLEFGPAPADDDGAYWAIYRGLAGFRNDLKANPR